MPGSKIVPLLGCCVTSTSNQTAKPNPVWKLDAPSPNCAAGPQRVNFNSAPAN